jgi:hypothetical protein
MFFFRVTVDRMCYGIVLPLDCRHFLEAVAREPTIETLQATRDVAMAFSGSSVEHDGIQIAREERGGTTAAAALVVVLTMRSHTSTHVGRVHGDI